MSTPIEAYRRAEGLTQRQLAEKLGVRQATVSAWCNGKRPRADMMQRIAQATGGAVQPADWFSDEAAA